MQRQKYYSLLRWLRAFLESEYDRDSIHATMYPVVPVTLLALELEHDRGYMWRYLKYSPNISLLNHSRRSFPSLLQSLMESARTYSLRQTLLFCLMY